jgi:hypothetical protein
MPASNYVFPASYPPSILGRRFSYGGKIYLADNIGMRWIENPTVYNALFRDWNGITALHDPPKDDPNMPYDAYLRSGTPDYLLFMSAPAGKALADGAALMKDAAPAVYLVEQGKKRLIVSPNIMDQYSFNWNAIQIVPTATLEPLQTGTDIDAEPRVNLAGATVMYQDFYRPWQHTHLSSAM